MEGLDKQPGIGNKKGGCLMIDILLSFGTEIILVKVAGNNIKFSQSNFGAVESDISGLKLSYEGVIKEFPDLKDDENWKDKAVQRFKEHIKSLETEKEKADYIINDLQKFGYTAMYKQRKGFRREVIK